MCWDPVLPLHGTSWHFMIVQITCEEEMNPDTCGLYLRVKWAHSRVPPREMSQQQPSPAISQLQFAACILQKWQIGAEPSASGLSPHPPEQSEALTSGTLRSSFPSSTAHSQGPVHPLGESFLVRKCWSLGHLTLLFIVTRSVLCR